MGGKVGRIGRRGKLSPYVAKVGTTAHNRQGTKGYASWVFSEKSNGLPARSLNRNGFFILKGKD